MHMKEYFTSEEFGKIEQLTNYALNAINKKEAQRHINDLQFLGYGLSGRTNNIFNELVCYIKDASGRVKDKERHVASVKSKLYELEVYGVKK